MDKALEGLAGMPANPYGPFTVVTETVHHGDYRSTRRVHLDSLAPSEVAKMLRSCSYTPSATAAQIKAVGEGLAFEGRAELGWVSWVLEED